jgi:hypothetical protein
VSSSAVCKGLASAGGMDAMGSSSGIPDGTDISGLSFDDGKGVIFVGDVSMYVDISFGTAAGVTFSTIVKDGSRRTVVGST